LYPTQKDLAKSIGMDTGNFTRFMKLVELPRFVIDAFKSPLDIKVHYATDLLKLLENEKHKNRLQEITQEIKNREMDGVAVYRALLNASNESIKNPKKPVEVIKSETGQILLAIKTKKEHCFEIIINKNSDKFNAKEAKEKLVAVIEKYINNG
jgi:hypothetical protein